MSLTVFVFLLSVAWLAACGAGALLDVLWRMRGAGRDLHPWALRAPRMLVMIPVIGVVVALASLVPVRAWTWFTGTCACQAYGGVHVCPLHFRQAAWLLMLLVPVALALLLRRLRGLAAVAQRLRDLEHLASVEEPRADGLIPLAREGKPTIFVAGAWRARVVVDSLWWERLEARERAAILAHERAHIEARDTSAVAALEILLRLVAPRACSRIIRDWKLGSEMRADAAAAKQDGDPYYVAELLCRHARSVAPGNALEFGGVELDARVRALLDGRSPEPASFGASACLGALFVACVSGHAAHRLFEAVLLWALP